MADATMGCGGRQPAREFRLDILRRNAIGVRRRQCRRQHRINMVETRGRYASKPLSVIDFRLPNGNDSS
jgi:hypothetical protein